MTDYRISDSGRILPGGMENEIHRLPMRIAGASLLGMAAIGWISLLTWSFGDPSLNRATGGAPSNLLGESGASLADMLFQLLGLSAIALFLPPAVWGLILISNERINNPRHRLAMWCISLILLASTLSIVHKPEGWPLAHGIGGIVGDFGKSVFLAIGGILHHRLAAPVGGAIAGFFAIWTLMRACGFGLGDIRTLFKSSDGTSHGILGAVGAGATYVAYGISSFGQTIAKAMHRDSAQPNRQTSPYWTPEDHERFNPGADRRAPQNARYDIYEDPQTHRHIPHTRLHRAQSLPQQMPQQDERERIEPYFDPMRMIPQPPPVRQPAEQAVFHPAPPQSYPVPQPAPPHQTQQPGYTWQGQQAPMYQGQPVAQHPPQHQHMVQQPAPPMQQMQAPMQVQVPAQQQYYQQVPQYTVQYQPQPAPYANENGAHAGQVEPVAAQEAPAQEVAATPIIRGGYATPPQQIMPDRSTREGGNRGNAQHLNPDIFTMPPIDLLSPPPQRQSDPEMSDSALGRRAEMLQSVLEDFRVKGQITGVHPGPVITLYEFEPARGTKSSRVIGLADDIARSMSAVSARVAVIPGRDAIGIELPNQNREVVYLRELLEARDFSDGKGRLQLALGKTIGGDPVVVDLARMPHLLIAGTTGSGKSVAINTMILSLLYRMSPEECRFLMIDPKMLELSVYDGIPHLLTPVVTDPHQAIKALKWTVAEMNSRYERMCKLGVRNIMGFNQKVARAERTGEPLARTVQTGFDEENGSPIYEREHIDPTPMPYIVVVIDEMADLMMVAGKDIEFAVQRLSQMARAAGIHLIMATQRPSVDVITGTIKANFPSRISFQVTSKIDSRTILGEMGAEQLLGAGDMLTMAAGGRIMRAHGPFVSDDEVEDIVNFLRSQGEPEYLYGVLEDEAGDQGQTGSDDGAAGGAGNTGDEVYDQAIQVVLRDKRPTTSYLQRRLGIGYNRAASLIERMEADGIISAPNRTGKREVIAGEQA